MLFFRKEKLNLENKGFARLAPGNFGLLQHSDERAPKTLKVIHFEAIS
jgi:hypothetical protein